eukprot:scaffold20950_cov46-Phaeocystis_antarctica.AAC.3
MKHRESTCVGTVRIPYTPLRTARVCNQVNYARRKGVYTKPCVLELVVCDVCVCVDCGTCILHAKFETCEPSCRASWQTRAPVRAPRRNAERRKDSGCMAYGGPRSIPRAGAGRELGKSNFRQNNKRLSSIRAHPQPHAHPCGR